MDQNNSIENRLWDAADEMRANSKPKSSELDEVLTRGIVRAEVTACLQVVVHPIVSAQAPFSFRRAWVL